MSLFPDRYVLTSLNVMVLDDDPSMQQILKSMLRRCGVQTIESFGDGAEALERMRSFHPDVILVDWEMEPVHGGDFMRFVRTDSRFYQQQIGLFVVTGFADEKRVAQAINAGADDFIAKPLSVNSVKNKIFRYIDRRRYDLQARCANPTYNRIQELSNRPGSSEI